MIRRSIGLHHVYLFSGGIERMVANIAHLMVDMGYHCFVVIEEKLTDMDYAVPDGVIVYSLAYVKSEKERSEYLKKILYEENVDIYIEEYIHQKTFDDDVALVHSLGAKYIMADHSAFLRGLMYFRNEHRLARKVSEKIDGIIVLSELSRKLWSSYGVRAYNIPNFTLEVPKQFDNTRSELVWVGRLNYVKNWEAIFEVMNGLKDSGINLSVFGRGEKEEVQKFERMIIDNNLQECVKYKGYIADVSKIYKNAKILLNTSYIEGFPVTILEAKSLGIPIVTFNIPSDILQDQKGYISVDQGDVEGYIEAVREICSNSELEQQLIKEGLESADNYSYSSAKTRWDKFIVDVLSGGTSDQQDALSDSEILQLIDMAYHLNYVGYLSEHKKSNLFFAQMIKGLADVQGKKLATYAYGKIGKKMQRVLEDNCVKVDMIIDNIQCEHSENIISINQFAEFDTENYLVLLCSVRIGSEADSQLRNQLYEVVDKQSIVDVSKLPLWYLID